MIKLNSVVTMWSSWECGVVVGERAKVKLMHCYLGSDTWARVVLVLVVGMIMGVGSLVIITSWRVVFIVSRVGVAVNMIFGMVGCHPLTVVLVTLLTPAPVTIIVGSYGVGVLGWMLEPVRAWWTLESARLWWAL